MRSPVEDHDLVPSLPDNLKSQTHSRCLYVMADLLSRLNQIQSTEWSLYPVFKQICQKWFTPHVDLFATHLNHKVPLYVPPVPDQNAWDIDHPTSQLPVSRTLLKQSHNYVFHSNPQHLNLHTWCLRVDSSKNKASLWRWQRELLLLKGHQQGPSTSQSGPYLRNGAAKIRWISPLPL